MQNTSQNTVALLCSEAHSHFGVDVIRVRTVAVKGSGSLCLKRVTCMQYGTHTAHTQKICRQGKPKLYQNAMETTA